MATEVKIKEIEYETMNRAKALEIENLKQKMKNPTLVQNISADTLLKQHIVRDSSICSS